MPKQQGIELWQCKKCKKIDKYERGKPFAWAVVCDSCGGECMHIFAPVWEREVPQTEGCGEICSNKVYNDCSVCGKKICGSHRWCDDKGVSFCKPCFLKKEKELEDEKIEQTIGRMFDRWKDSAIRDYCREDLKKDIIAYIKSIEQK